MTPHHTHRHHRYDSDIGAARDTGSPIHEAARKLYPMPPDASQHTVVLVEQQRAEWVEANR